MWNLKYKYKTYKNETIFKNINRKDSNIFKLSKTNAELGIIN